MQVSNYTNIGETEKFNAENYPSMVAELTSMLKDLHQIPIYFKRDIIVSYLKDHCVKTEWIDANPVLVKMMTSGTLITHHLERLFEGCRWNKIFRADFERYVKARIN